MNLNSKWKIIFRYILVAIFVFLTIIFLIGYFWKDKNIILFNDLPSDFSYISSFFSELVALPLDFGSISSLFAALAVALLLRIDSEIWTLSNLENVIINNENSNKNVRQRSLGTAILLLGIAGIIGIWLSIRTFGIFTSKYIVEAMVESKLTNFPYFISDIFTMIGFILITNLCFTLVETLSKATKNNKQIETIQDLITTPIQATIIGLIIILPRYSDYLFISSVGGINGYIMVIGILLASLVVLCLLLLHLKKPKHLNT